MKAWMSKWVFTWLNRIKKSKTLIFSLLLSLFGVLELQFSVLQPMLGEYYGLAFIAVSIVTAWLRILTTTSVDSK